MIYDSLVFAFMLRLRCFMLVLYVFGLCKALSLRFALWVYRKYNGCFFTKNPSQALSGKTVVKLRFQGVRRNPFARNEVRSSETDGKLRFQGVRRNPFARNEVRSSKTVVKLRFPGSRCNPFTRNEGRSPKTEVFSVCTKLLCAVCQSFCV